MTTMKLYLHTAIASLLLFASAGLLQQMQAQEVQSDYEIVQNFNKTYNDLSDRLDKVSAVKEAKKLVDDVKSLQGNYSEHKELLNKALYPQTFEEKMNKLSSQVQSAHQRLQTIARQEDKLKQLTGNVNDFETQLEKLQQKSDSLQKVLANMNQRNRSLSSTVRNYRESVSERDRLVLNIIDSLLANYQQLDTQTLKELSMAYKQSKKNIDNNALKLIQTIARTNIEFLNSSQTLSTGDYLRMYSVQQKFRDMWNKIGDELIKIYKPDAGAEAVQSELQGSLDEWETKVADQTWKSMNRAFDENGIELSEFGDSQGLYQSLTNYVDNGIKEGDRKQYQNFSQFWNNTVKTQWAEYITGTNILSYDQMTNVDKKLNEWDSKTASSSYLWKILVAVAVLIIIVLGIMLARAKS